MTAGSGTAGWAIALAAIGAVLFGLAALRQHGVVSGTVTADRKSVRDHLAAAVGVLRNPTWLIGEAQAGLAATLHIVALTLAPITLVQPIGVLAVPVTVVLSAVRARRRPSTAQLAGTVLSVIGVVVLTALLLAPSAGPVTLPSWSTLAVVVALVVVVGTVVIVSGSRGRPLVRCVALSVSAAVLFGLNSILIRVVGHLFSTRTLAANGPLIAVAVIGLAISLLVGLWANQTAYVSGAPQVVICCLTLVDPVAAVLGGRLLLHDGSGVGGLVLVGAAVCAVLASAGVVLLSSTYPTEELLAG